MCDDDIVALPRRDVHTLKANQRVNWAARLRSLEIGFDNFVAINCAGISHSYGCSYRVASFDVIGR